MEFATAFPWILAIAGGLFGAYGTFISRGIWRNVAEGRQEKIDDLEKRLVALEAKVDVLTGEFARDVADRVVEEIRGRT